MTYPEEAADTDFADDVKAGGCGPSLNSDRFVGEPGQHETVDTVHRSACDNTNINN